MSSDPNTVASLLSRMEDAGLLERRPHETDRRARRIHLLALGRRRYETARKLALELQGEVLDVLPEPEREKFLENLAAVANACRTASGSPARGE